MQNYQVRLASMIKKFGAPKGGKDIADVERFRSKVPDTMIEFWQLHGTGTILNGYFQFCDLCDYASIVKLIFDGDSQLNPEQTYVLGFGAFGSMVLWNEVYRTVPVDLVRGHVSCWSLVSGKANDPNTALTTALICSTLQHSMNMTPTLESFLSQPARRLEHSPWVKSTD